MTNPLLSPLEIARCALADIAFSKDLSRAADCKDRAKAAYEQVVKLSDDQPSLHGLQISFQNPGQITVTVGVPEAGDKRWSHTLNMEDIWNRISSVTTNREEMKEWETIFLRLAQMCNSARF